MATRKEDKKPDPMALIKPWLDITEAKAFLSNEFLLWTWFFAESPANPLPLRLPSLGGQETMVKLWIEDRLVLESADSKAHVHTLRGGEPSRSMEAESALQTGKQVKELRLGLHIDPYGDFLVLLASKDLSPKAITLPTIQNAGDGKMERFDLSTRLKMTDVLIEAVDALFARFLELRIHSESWKNQIRAMDQWITSRGHAETHLH